MGIMGQAVTGKLKHDPTASAFPPDQNYMRILTVLGSAGAVLALRMVQEENVQLVADSLGVWFHPEERAQVKYVGVDKPSQALVLALRKHFPNMKLVYLDATHLCMRYEKCFARHRSPGSAALRRVMAKFSSVNPSMEATSWGKLPYEGIDGVPHSAVEVTFV